MICHRCTHRLALSPLSRSITPRYLSTTTTRSNPSNPPPATSTSAAQPFSTPFTPSPSKTPDIPRKSSKSTAPTITSSLPAGTPLKGLGFTKGQEPPLAREDHEYPGWLWGLLKEKSVESEGEVGDAFAKSKKQRRIAAKAERASLAGGRYATQHTVRVPLEQQSIDLPAGMGSKEAQGAREELGGEMRKARRRRIKEGNFLRGMR